MDATTEVLSGGWLPLTAAAHRIGWSRERLLRAVQTGTVRGAQVLGRWVVDPASLEELRLALGPDPGPEQER